MTDDIHVTHRPAPMRKWADGGDGDEATNVGAGERSGVVCTWVKAMLSGIAVMVCFHLLQQYAVDVRHCRSPSMSISFYACCQCHRSSLSWFAIMALSHRSQSRLAVIACCHGLPSQLSVMVYSHGSLSWFAIAVCSHGLPIWFTEIARCHGLPLRLAVMIYHNDSHHS